MMPYWKESQKKEIEKILDVDPLWDAGIADLLIEMGRMSEEELEKYLVKFEEE